MDRTEFGQAICEALGEKVEDVISIDISISSEHPTTARIKKFIQDDDAPTVIEVIKTVEWKEV